MQQPIFENIKVDMHMHTSFSDGKFTPRELIDRAKGAGLNVISITDHDNVSAIAEAIEYGKSQGIEVIPGIELSADLNEKEVHILGYFIDYKNEELLKYLSDFREERINRVEKMITRLNNLGGKMKLSDVVNGSDKNVSIGRPHIAKAMVATKFVRSYAEAFMKYIGDDKPAYVKKANPSAKDVIKLINSIGGLSFIAHPGRYIRDSILYDLIADGIDGIEIVHPSHSKPDMKYFSEEAAQNFLLMSGGSDFHGLYEADFQNFGKYVIDANNVVNMRRRLF